MLKRLTRLAAIAALCGAAFFALKPSIPTTHEPTHLPWQITTFDDGRSEVFKLVLEQTTLGQALKLLGEDHELGIIANQDNYSALEVYFSHFASGPLKGKLILVIDAPEEALRKIQDKPAASKYMASGARQFSLSGDDLVLAQQWPIKSLTFIPAANLKQEVIEQRFGIPAERIDENDTTQHLLYPDLGLDVVINQDAKEKLIYVAPRAFSSLSGPLHALNTE